MAVLLCRNGANPDCDFLVFSYHCRVCGGRKVARNFLSLFFSVSTKVDTSFFIKSEFAFGKAYLKAQEKILGEKVN